MLTPDADDTNSITTSSLSADSPHSPMSSSELRIALQDSEDHREKLQRFIDQVLDQIGNPMHGVSEFIEQIKDILDSMKSSPDAWNPQKLDEIKEMILEIEQCNEAQKKAIGKIIQRSLSPQLSARIRRMTSVAEDSRSKRILVVDDSRTNQGMLCKILSTKKYECVVANNGLEAITLWTSAISDDAPFRVILMDIQMPVMDGLAAINAIRTMEKSLGSKISRTSIITITMYDSEDYREKANQAGTDFYMVKPYQREPILQTVNRCFCRKHTDKAELLFSQASKTPHDRTVPQVPDTFAAATAPTVEGQISQLYKI